MYRYEWGCFSQDAAIVCSRTGVSSVRILSNRLLPLNKHLCMSQTVSLVMSPPGPTVLEAILLNLSSYEQCGKLDHSHTIVVGRARSVWQTAQAVPIGTARRAKRIGVPELGGSERGPLCGLRCAWRHNGCNARLCDAWRPVHTPPLHWAGADR